jgi:Endonuclease/Exonuclease/phosphatase family
VITAAVKEGLLLFGAHVLILNEFCPSSKHEDFCAWLRANDYAWQAISPAARDPNATKEKWQNRVFIASRNTMLKKDVAPFVVLNDVYTTQKWLHVTFPDDDTELIGLRIHNKVRKLFFETMLETLLAFSDRRMIVMGDFNVDRGRRNGERRPNGEKPTPLDKWGDDCIKALEAKGWTNPPAGCAPFSHYKGGVGVSRVDHVLLHDCVDESVKYVKRRSVTGSKRMIDFIGEGLSDHTPLEVIVKD